MDAPSLFSDKELAFLAALVEGEVSFLVVGLAAAALQGAPAVTQDVDLWFRDLADPRLTGALQRIGASYIPPTHSTPPLLAGAGTDLFDIVVHMHGLESFDQEVRRATLVQVGGSRRSRAAARAHHCQQASHWAAEGPVDPPRPRGRASGQGRREA